MDAVRFGRALGVGARAAAKTLVTAADAATAENPSRKTVPARTASRMASSPVPVTPVVAPQQAAATAPVRPIAQAAQTVARTVTQGREAKKALGRGRKRFGQAFFEPLVRLSGVLWMEVSGVFFGIFALFAMAAVWRLRGNWHAGTQARKELAVAAAMLVVFGYFCISNFVRARRREKRR
jgi:hypothetical protein